jgi:hypothetical protein
VPFERKDGGREAGPLLSGTNKLRLRADSFSSGASLGGKAVS